MSEFVPVIHVDIEGAPMEVERVGDDRGSHIEPPLDPSWSNYDQIRWKAGCIQADVGVTIYTVRGRRGRVGFRAPGWSTSDRDFDSAWDYLNGVSTGAEMARKQAPPLVVEINGGDLDPATAERIKEAAQEAAERLNRERA